MTNKMYFIDAIEKLLKLDDRNTVDTLTYTRSEKGASPKRRSSSPTRADTT